jgi:putative transposase
LLERIGDFASFLAGDEDTSATGALRAAETTGRPLGNEAFIEGLERLLGRKLARGRPGPPPKSTICAEQQDLWG